MIDPKKVIKGLECCRNRHLCMCHECPYYESNTNPDDEDDNTCTFDLNDDALALLKEQEDERKRNPVIVCPHCGKRVK